MFTALLILIFIRPFISSLAFPYVNFLYSFLLLGLLSIWIVVKKISLDKIKAIKYPLLIFILALFISLVFSSDKIISLKELYKYLTGILLILTGLSLSGKDRKQVIFCMVSAGVLISLLAIYQYLFGFQHLLTYIIKEKVSNSFTLDYISRRRIFFPFVTPNTLAGYLAMIIPLALSYKNKIWLMIPLSFALLLTKSLGGLLSVFLALAIYFYLQGKLKKGGIIFLSGLLVIIGVVFMVRAAAPQQHLQPIFSTIMRLNYWKGALKIIKMYPLAGVGLGNFNLPQSRYAHNSYLQIWAEMGILGIISILWLAIAIIKSALKKINGAANSRTAALIAANFAFLFHNLLDFTFFLPEVSLIWWLILCLLLPSDSGKIPYKTGF